MWSQDKYIKALGFAAEKHLGQLYPGTGWSYVVHLSMVAMEVTASLGHENGVNGDLAVQSAVLHDTIEDTGTTHAEIEEHFGKDVADGVLALTKNEEMEKELRMADSLRRIKTQPREIWMVKLADRITNLQKPPSHWDMAKRKKYLDEAGMIYHELNQASRFLSERLMIKISAYERFLL